jgi:uncharacterized RDD family membrane protein YckC
MAYQDDILNIDTPENVAFAFDIAGIGSRFIASLIDTFLTLALITLIVLGTLAFMRMATPDDMSRDLLETYFSWIIGAVGLLTFAIQWGYYIFFEMLWNGQSPGKRIVRLRVIRTDGGPISLSESVVRNLVRMVDMLPAAYGVGVITMFASRQSRRLGDLAAGTLVVHDHKPAGLEGLDDLIVAPARPAAPAPASGLAAGNGVDLPPERLSPRDLQTVDEFLHRREKLPNREALAGVIARGLHSRLGRAGEPPQGALAEQWLEELAQRNRTEG